MHDGFSTGGTSGTGLGAVRRLSSAFDVHSTPPAGTVVFCRVAAGTDSPPASRTSTGGSSLEWGVVCVPAPGETVCGDAWRVAGAEGEAAVIIADGLGHGPLAADAARQAAAAFETSPLQDARSIVEAAHDKTQGTRGAAVAVARVNSPAGVLRYAGVGNISGTLLNGGESRGLFSHNGTVGVQVRKVQEFEYPWDDAAMLVMHSDGLQTRWDLDAYPGLRFRHPAVIAAVLYRDFCRGRDDATVLVVRLRAGGSPLP